MLGYVLPTIIMNNDRALCVYAPLGHSTREQLPRGSFFEELKNCMKKKMKEIQTK